MTEEVWKPISGFEGLYEVSNFGQVRSISLVDRAGRFHEGRILSQIDNGHGYRVVNLKVNGKQKMMSIHRLVAVAFVENVDPFNKIEVNHIDANKSNNKASNLVWCTHSENMIHAERMGLCKNKGQRSVICVELDMLVSSVKLAEKFVGVRGRRISNCCKLLRGAKTCAGFHWKYADEVEK